MTVYILHLDAPLHHAKHYVGFVVNGHTLKHRIAHHANGTAGCRFTQVLHDLGIGFQLARVFKCPKFDRSFERKLKKTKNVNYYCPICAGVERPYHPKESK